MLEEGEVLAEGEVVPVEATATGIIVWWIHRPGETLAGIPIVLEEGDPLCVIDAKVDGFPRDVFVGSPATGKLVKIIKEEKESVEKGEPIGEMEPYVQIPSPRPFPWGPIPT